MTVIGLRALVFTLIISGPVGLCRPQLRLTASFTKTKGAREETLRGIARSSTVEGEGVDLLNIPSSSELTIIFHCVLWLQFLLYCER